MTTLSAFKKAFVIPVILAGVFATQAIAADLDSDGFRNDKTCDTMEVVKNSVTKLDKQQPTGLKASNAKWDMEMYQDADGRWSLVGINKSPKDKYEQARVLMSGPAKRPYASQPFYAKFFVPGADKPRIAAATPDVKPSLN